MNKLSLFKSAPKGAATLSDDERRELLSLSLPTDCSLRSVHAGTNPPTVEYVQYQRGVDGYRIYDNPPMMQASYEISDDLTVTFGVATAVIAKTVYEPVAVASFSLTESGTPYEKNGAMVYPAARLFSIGDYSDKGFKKPVTATELQTLVSTFTVGNAPVNIEHESIIAETDSKTARALHGHMGQVSRVWMSDTADWVHGEVQIPLWLDAAIKTGVVPSKLSVEVYPDTMKLAGVALTGNPRVPNAALLSAYQKQPKGTEMTELTEAAETSLVDKIAAKVTSFFTGKDGHQPTHHTTERIPPQGGTSVTEIKPVQVEDPRVATMSAQIAKMETERINEKAAMFADSVIGKTAMPKERANIIHEYVSAATDDQRMPANLVTFAAGTETKTGTRVDALTARYADRPSLAYLFKDSNMPVEVIGSDSIVKMSAEDEAKAAKARQAKLLSMSDLGETALAKMNEGGK